ncbi:MULTISPECIES: LysR family transcriptional regulator [unclassified Rhodococcus (in: high G+C Gram-positive bacteria)]|uniref:LysR family transcriptional regulator n=1 Tax=unclassified Rhodococcus (in: high G+C Gram-positive bacteria) TaxID=192944 RepID=UPI00163AD057|nr:MULTISPECIES: LysR family transcriptional regulator [unclassified Rhodococcus (in: high G+C Gram-positive bacteria)]MBC2638168.1 LysR family transcriptional regulator [Rhodococcus sp. 3A]MBC2897089.1 LysR family transcriptional regulator [Rhodococcus sp. 4CII]
MRADDLLVLLEIARCKSLVGAGAALGLNHTTVSRRIAALERELNAPVISRSAQGCELTELGNSLLGSCEQIETALFDARDYAHRRKSDQSLSGLVRVATTEAFGAYFVTPVLADLHKINPELQVEIVTQTRLNPYSSGADIEIGVGEPVLGRLGAEALTQYSLGLYASDEYARDHGLPHSTDELRLHSLIYYIEGLLRVEDLVVLGQLTTQRHATFASTSVQAQAIATLAGAGIGLLPAYVADREPTLQRVLFPEVRIVPEYTAWLASGRLRRPAAPAVMQAIREAVAERQSELLPE